MNAPVKIEIPSRVNLSDAARSAMAGVSTYREGAERLLDLARQDPELMAAIMEPYELSAAMDAVQKTVSDFRRLVWVSPDREAQAERVEALIRSNRAMLLDFPLPGGLALRFATKADVNAAAGFYRDHATDMAHKSRWLLRIARRVPAGQTVAQALDNPALEKLQKETKNG